MNCNNSSNGRMVDNKAFFLKKIARDKENVADRLYINLSGILSIMTSNGLN